MLDQAFELGELAQELIDEILFRARGGRVQDPGIGVGRAELSELPALDSFAESFHRSMNLDHLSSQPVDLLVPTREGTAECSQHLIAVLTHDRHERVAELLGVDALRQLFGPRHRQDRWRVRHRFFVRSGRGGCPGRDHRRQRWLSMNRALSQLVESGFHVPCGDTGLEAMTTLGQEPMRKDAFSESLVKSAAADAEHLGHFGEVIALVVQGLAFLSLIALEPGPFHVVPVLGEKCFDFFLAQPKVLERAEIDLFSA